MGRNIVKNETVIGIENELKLLRIGERGAKDNIKRGRVTEEEFHKVLGVVTTGDLNRLIEHEEKFFHLEVGQIMTKNPKLIQSGTLASEALKQMEEYHVVAMPVIDDANTLLGVVHLHDILDVGIRD